MKNIIISICLCLVYAVSSFGANTNNKKVITVPIYKTTYKYQCSHCHKNYIVDCYKSDVTNKYYHYKKVPNGYGAQDYIYKFVAHEKRTCCLKCQERGETLVFGLLMMVCVIIPIIGAIISEINWNIDWKKPFIQRGYK